MPRKVTKKTSRKKTTEAITPEVLDAAVEDSVTSKKPSKKFFIIGAVVIAVAAILFLGKSLLLASVVNGKPIFRYQLDRELEKKYGAQELDNLVIENLISQEAQKQKINITKADIDKEIETVKKTLPQGTDLNTALQAQGMTMEDFTKQIIIKLTAERILNPQIKVSDQEIEEFATKSASMFSSTDSAKQKVEAETILREQKLSDAFNTWIQDLRSKAQIITFSL